MKPRMKRLGAVIIGGLIAAHPVCSVAESNQERASKKPGNAADMTGITEIIVTAQKREEKLSNVGLTVAVVGATQLKNLGVADISRLPSVISSFTVVTGWVGLSSFSIRGLGFESNQLSASPTVSTYLDEAPLPYPAMTGDVTLDVERVEVVKGPQGTLFGNNSTGGSVNFIAAKPTDVLSGGFTTSVDRFGQFSGDAFVSGPIAPTLKARLAVSTTQGGDWQKTYTPGPEKETGAADKGAERLTLDWRPSDKLKVSFTENAYFDRSDPQIEQLTRAQPSGGPGSGIVVAPYGSIETYPLPPHDDRAADFANPGSTNYRFFQGVLRADYALNDRFTLISLTNYAFLKAYFDRPLDGTRIDIIQDGSAGTIQTYGEEVRLNGSFPDIGLTTITGLNYSYDTVSASQPATYDNFSILPPGFSLDPHGVFTSQTIAGFANAEWNATSHITLLGGLRYTVDKQTDFDCLPAGNAAAAGFFGGLANLLRGASGLGPTTAYKVGACATLGPAPNFLPFSYAASSIDRNVSWRAGLNYHVTPDLMPYVTISRGYKAGGYPFQTSITSAELSKVKQEEVTSYEIGAKYDLPRKLQTSIAAFYYDYVNKQVFEDALVPFLGPVSILANVPKSKAYGLDAEVRWVPASQWTLHAATTFTRTDVTDAGALNLDGFGNPVNYDRHSFAYAPKWSTVFDAEYHRPLGDKLEGFVGFNGLYESQQFGDLNNEELFKMDPYLILDARVGLRTDTGWAATLWIRNLTNRYYWNTANFGGDGFIKTTGMPRNFGVTVSYRF